MSINPNHLLKLGQFQTTLTALTTATDARYQKKADVLGYTIKKQATAESGYAATYQLFSVSADSTPVETAVGEKINIPKDMVVSGGEVKTVTQADVPYTGAVVGDKYIDLTIANAQADHLYIPVKDLVDVYTAGNGLQLSNNEFSVKIDNSGAAGLTAGANGLKLAEATTTAAGAMSAADKAKLDAADVTAYTGGNGIDVTSHEISAVVDANNANGLSVGANGLALAVATQSAGGAMSAADKTKLDGFEFATDAEITEICNGLFAS